jgi:hypothetical protein
LTDESEQKQQQQLQQNQQHQQQQQYETEQLLKVSEQCRRYVRLLICLSGLPTANIRLPRSFSDNCFFFPSSDAGTGFVQHFILFRVPCSCVSGSTPYDE